MLTVVISGGSSGVGKAIACLLAHKNYKVYELSRHSIAQPNVTHITCDVISQEQVNNALKRIIEEQKKIDVLICNSGYGISGAIEFSKEEDVCNQFNVNFMGVVHLIKATLPYMRQQNYGKILITGSLASIFPIPYQAFYSASKAALKTLAHALVNEVKAWHIEVTTVLLGDINTSFTKSRIKNENGKDIYTSMNDAISVMEKDEINGISPSAVADYFYKLIKRKHFAPLYVYGFKYKCLYFLSIFMPYKFVLQIIRALYIKK